MTEGARRRSASIAATLGLTFLISSPSATAHRPDLMKPTRAGPIIRGDTTMEEMRRWFGEPTSTKVIRVGCVRVRRVKWGNDLKVYASREFGTTEAIFVRARTITSTEHGDLTMHTREGLRVGDPERRLRRLYPNAEPITHAGHTHYRLKTGRDAGKLLAKVVDDLVVQFESWPYEFC